MKSKKNIVIGIAVSAILFLGLVVLARYSVSKPVSPSASAGQGRLMSEELSYDFGTVSMAKGVVSHTFALKNPSQDPVRITNIYTSCMCTTAWLVKNKARLGPYGMPGHALSAAINERLNAGETAKLETDFDPAAHGPAGVGPIERLITLDTDSDELQIRISAVVTP